MFWRYNSRYFFSYGSISNIVFLQSNIELIKLFINLLNISNFQILLLYILFVLKEQISKFGIFDNIDISSNSFLHKFKVLFHYNLNF